MRLGTTYARSPTLEDLTTDAEYVADFLKTLTGPVVLVGHSYGGSVITNAAAGIRKVKALVYVDAAAPDVGDERIPERIGLVLNRKPESEPSKSCPIREHRRVPPTSTCARTSSSSANDLPHDVAARLWASQRTASTEAFDTPSRHDA